VSGSGLFQIPQKCIPNLGRQGISLGFPLFGTAHGDSLFRPIDVLKSQATDFASAQAVDRAKQDRAARGLPYWKFDLSLAKRTPVTDRAAFLFSADFLNAFNHVVFNDPTLSMQDPASFGVISSQANNPRAIQFGLRLEF